MLQSRASWLSQRVFAEGKHVVQDVAVGEPLAVEVFQGKPVSFIPTADIGDAHSVPNSHLEVPVRQASAVPTSDVVNSAPKAFGCFRLADRGK